MRNGSASATGRSMKAGRGMIYTSCFWCTASNRSFRPMCPLRCWTIPRGYPALHGNGRNSVPPLTGAVLYGRQKSGGKCMCAEWSWQTAIPKRGMRERSTALLRMKQRLKAQRRGFRIPYRRTSAGSAPVCPRVRASRWALTA